MSRPAVTPEAVVDEARGWIGTPYRHGGALRGAGTDCLGLFRGVWRELHGSDLAPVPPYAPDWAEAGGAETLLEAARRHLVEQPAGPGRPGDVLLFRMRAGAPVKHLGLQSRAGPAPAFIHAYSGHGVVESALTAPWARRIAARFAFAGR